MGRGIFTGFIWGTVVGLGIIAVANEVVGPVVYTQPLADVAAVTDVADAAATPSEDATPEAVGETAAEPDRASAQGDEPEVADAGETEMAAGDAPTAPTTESDSPDAPMTPSDDDAAMAEAADEAPVLPSPQAMEPQADEAADAPVAPDAADVADTDMAEDMADKDVAETDMAEPEMAKPDATPNAKDDTPTTEAETDADTEVATEEVAVDATEEVAEPNDSLGEKVGSFTDRDDSRISTRLPSIAATDAPEEAAPVVVEEDLPALVAYSADFTGEISGPLMSIVLVDIAEIGPEDAIIANLPFPVSFGVDVLAPSAGERALNYREKGLEVLAMVGLPDGAQPTDAAQTLAQAREIIPVSVGFLDVPSASYQSTRQVAAQVVATSKDSGHGIVTFSRGLNAIEQEAQRETQPAALVFRDIDGRGQDVAAIKRFLDQAAFRAGIDGGIVLVGRSKPDTIQALAEWALGNRAATVSLVPVSLLLTGDVPAQ